MKTLIAYFSLSGNTAKVAKEIQNVTGGDLFEIKGKKNYGSYFHALGVARKEFSKGELPEVETEVKGFDTYDRILIGFPIWFSKAPQLVVSFIKGHDFKDKDVYLFCTSGMSGPEGAQNQLKDALALAKVHKGIRFGKVDEATVKNWLSENG